MILLYKKIMYIKITCISSLFQTWRYTIYIISMSHYVAVLVLISRLCFKVVYGAQCHHIFMLDVNLLFCFIKVKLFIRSAMLFASWMNEAFIRSSKRNTSSLFSCIMLSCIITCNGHKDLDWRECEYKVKPERISHIHVKRQSHN